MTAPRAVFVAWQCPANRAIYPVARLVVRDEAPRYEFVYVHGVRDARQKGFEPFAGMRQLDQIYLADDLFPLFSNRVMAPSRPDFPDYIERLGLQGQPEPVLVLARSEGRKVTDNLEVFAPPEFHAASGRWMYVAFARGVRHVLGAEDVASTLRAGDMLSIVRDVTNEWDARALLMLAIGQRRVGFVPHTLIEDIDRLVDLGAAIDAEVLRVNPSPAPVHQRLLVTIQAQHVEGFLPLSTQRYQPLAQNASVFRPEAVQHSG